MSNASQMAPEGGSNLIYHYTDQKGLLGIIGNRSLWATHLHHLNDESEWKIGCDLCKTYLEKLLKDETDIRRHFPLMSARLPGPELREALTEFVHGIVQETEKKNAFVVSFSGSGPHDFETGRTPGDDLNLWRAYAGGSGGFAIGFDRDALVKSIRALAQVEPLSAIPGHCIYDHPSLETSFRDVIFDHLQVAEEWVSMHANATQEESRLDVANKEGQVKAIVGLVTAIARVKHEAFRSENEWRLTVLHQDIGQKPKFRASKSGIIPYLELKLASEGHRISSIRRVVVGPSPQKEDSLKALKMFLRSSNYKVQEDGEEDGVLVQSSDIPYRNW